MSEIQSIANNNFILHNIDAKKLYVQEPLFTANSGDAIYVGWRPDETVLWSGNATIGTEMTLSEPFQNFEYIKIRNGHWDEDIKPASLLTGNQDGTYVFSYGNLNGSDATKFVYEQYCVLYSGHDDILKATSSIGFTLTTAGAITRSVNTNNYSTRTFRVLGVNRLSANNG